jgi:hypothetical protein
MLRKPLRVIPRCLVQYLTSAASSIEILPRSAVYPAKGEIIIFNRTHYEDVLSVHGCTLSCRSRFGQNAMIEFGGD